MQNNFTMEKRTKTLNYQLLHVYQTNSPVLCNEQKFKQMFKASYTQALIRFSLGLQEMFGLDPLFNQPERQAEQKAKIKDLYATCFKEFLGKEHLFRDTLTYLISGTVMSYNFAYGFKLYFLFKRDERLEKHCKKLFGSRIEANICSRYYEKHPSKKFLETEDRDILKQALKAKLSRYKMFC